MTEVNATWRRVAGVLLEALRPRTVSYSRLELGGVLLVAALVATWLGAAGGGFSLGALLACELVFFAYYLAGSLVATNPSLAKGVLVELPLRLLVGYAVVNTALLVLAWLSPLGIVANFTVVLSLIVVVFVSSREHVQRRSSAASLCALGLCGVAATLWCQDSLQPIVDDGRVVVFQPWIDGFYHSVHIRIFAESHGASTIQDFRMAGVPARPYHYGVYMLPAFVKALSGIHSYTAFAGLLAPVGVLFTGLSAYALFGSLWGAWSGLFACSALLLLPDGAEQGLRNPFMSYHWLTQISPSASYGLALLGLAWLFVRSGCVQGNRQQLLAGWGIAALLVAYKLHFMVASALLLLLVPAFFFQAKLRWYQRGLWVGGACAFYGLALLVGQQVPGVPVIRFDGSSIGEMLHLIGTFQVPGPLRDFVTEHMGRPVAVATNLAYGIPYVLLTVLGGFVPLLALGLFVLRKRMPLVDLVLPLLLVANFLAMFFGLALEMRSSTPDELLHRPLMVVYFFVVGWVGGGLGLLLARARLRVRVRVTQIAGITLASLLLFLPASLGDGVQRMWVMPRMAPVKISSAMYRIAEHIRTHGKRDDLLQDSQFDRFFALSALAERHPFVEHTMYNMPYRGELVATRSAAVDRIMGLRSPKLIVATARALGIRWFVRHPGDRVRWPPELADNPALRAGRLSLYDFDDGRFLPRAASGAP